MAREFKGTISNARIWDRVLTPEEIRAVCIGKWFKDGEDIDLSEELKEDDGEGV